MRWMTCWVVKICAMPDLLEFVGARREGDQALLAPQIQVVQRGQRVAVHHQPGAYTHSLQSST